MEIIHEWFVNGNLRARYYKCSYMGKWEYFLDCMGCKKTIPLQIQSIGHNKVLIRGTESIPKTYQTSIENHAIRWEDDLYRRGRVNCAPNCRW